jgi:hypothetical protein
LELAGSVVEYDGFLVSGAAMVSPSLQYDGANTSVGVQGSWLIFESGSEIVRFSAAGAWLTNPGGRWRAELSGSIGFGHYERSDPYGHLFARTKVHYAGRRGGTWLGLATGVSFGDYEGTPVELALGAWSAFDEVGVAGSITTTALAGGQYVDLSGAARWTRNNFRLDAKAGAVGFSGGEGGGAYAEVSAMYHLSQRVALTASGGRYRSDPARGILGARYVNVGLRLNLSSRSVSVVPTIIRALAAVEAELEGSDYGSTARLEVQNSGSGGVLLLRVERASMVEIMGDFTDWVAVPLQRVGNGAWEFAAPVPPGVHRLNIRIDGGPWLVPFGTRLEETDFGSAVGVVVVPSIR